MKKISFFILFSIILIFNSYSSYAKIIDGIAAIVNNDIITISDLNLALLPFKEKLKFANISKEEKLKEFEKIKEKILDKLINDKLIEQQAKKMNYQVTEEDIDNVINNILKEQNLTIDQLKEALKQSKIPYKHYREQLKSEILRARVVNSYVKSEIKISREEVEKYIKENFISDKKAEYHIKQIFFKNKDEEKINNALKALKNTPFEEVAKKYSEGPFKDKGGDLGYFKQGEMLPEIDKAVRKMKEGEIKLIKTRAGFHIVKLVDIKTNQSSKEKLFKKAEAILKSKKLKNKINEWIKQLREKAVIVKKI